MRIGIKIFKPLDAVIFIAAILLGILFCVRLTVKSGATVCVTVGDEVYEYDSSKNGIYSVQGLTGETVFEIKDGAVRIIDSSCPNKICVAQGWDSPLVCLPNGVIITLEQDGEFDALAE